jgi:hypothetical protein
MRNDLNKVVYKAKLLPDIAYCLVQNRDDLIKYFKQKAVGDLIEEYPNITYSEIYFDLQKMSGHELYESVEYFKTASGRYLYQGEFVSREWLKNELAQLDTLLTMTAWIKEKENEKDF